MLKGRRQRSPDQAVILGLSLHREGDVGSGLLNGCAGTANRPAALIHIPPRARTIEAKSGNFRLRTAAPSSLALRSIATGSPLSMGQKAAVRWGKRTASSLVSGTLQGGGSSLRMPNQPQGIDFVPARWLQVWITSRRARGDHIFAGCKGRGRRPYVEPSGDRRRTSARCGWRSARYSALPSAIALYFVFCTSGKNCGASRRSDMP